VKQYDLMRVCVPVVGSSTGAERANSTNSRACDAAQSAQSTRGNGRGRAGAGWRLGQQDELRSFFGWVGHADGRCGGGKRGGTHLE
jgi:hypothetical protein